MKQIIFTSLMLLLAYNTKETEELRCYDVPIEDNNELLYSSLWAEARGIRHTQEIVIVLDCYRNRVNKPQWPSTLDSVVLQDNQFALSKDTPTNDFKALVDSLLTKPIRYPYVHFVNFKRLKKKPKWIKKKTWVKLGIQYYSK